MTRCLAVCALVAAACDRSSVHFTGPPDGAPTDAPPTGTHGAMPAFDKAVDAVLHVGTSWYVGGEFTRVSPHPAAFLAALDPSGAPQECMGGFDGRVTAVARYGTAVYVGGGFTHYKGATANYIAKLDAATCTLDTTFSPQGGAPNGFTSGSTQPIEAFAATSMGLYVAGYFTSYRGAEAWMLAKLDPTTGALDTQFTPTGATGPEDGVIALAVLGNRVFIGGAFTSYQGMIVNHIAKLDAATGALDTSFGAPGANAGFPGPGAYPFAFAIDGGSLYVGGNFTAYRGVAGSANRIAKLDVSSGALDTTFSPPAANGFDDAAHALLVFDGALYVGGGFHAYRGAAGSAQHIARLDLTSGTLDTTFSPPSANGFDPGGDVRALVAAGSTLYAGGGFATYRGRPAHCIAKLDVTTGAQDVTFKPAGSSLDGFDDGVTGLAFDGATLWAGGYFTLYGGDPHNGLVKLDDTTFAVDTTFSPPGGTDGFDGTVFALAASGASLYVGGSFTGYRGRAASANAIAKLDLATGALDTTFSPLEAPNGFPAGSSVSALAVAGTSLYVGGAFDTYRGVAHAANFLAKLDLATGAIDTTFSPVGATANGFDDAVLALAVAGNSLYVGGTFSAYKGVPDSANAIAKLDLATGAQDITFSPPGATGNGFTRGTFRSFTDVRALVSSSTALYVGGQFTTYRGVKASANNLAKLDLASGALDTTFSPPGAMANGFDAPVGALAITSGALYVGGELTAYRGAADSAEFLAKLDAVDGTLDVTFSPPGVKNNGFTGDPTGGSHVLALGVSGTTLVCGGGFIGYRHDVPAMRGMALDAVTGAP